MNKSNMIKIVTVLTMVTIALTLTTTASDWSQFQKDEVNIGRTADSAPIDYVDLEQEDVTINYTQSGSGCGIDSVPIVVGNYVYVVATSKLFKFNKATGNEEWNTTVDTAEGFQLSSPAYGNGRGTGTETIFVANNKHRKLYAINATSGAERWNVTVSTAQYGQLNTPITYYNNSNIELIFFGEWISSGDDPRKYCCYNVTANATTTNNTKVWDRTSTSGGGYYWAGAAVVGNYLVYGDDKSNVTSVYLINGTTVSEVNVSAEYSVNAKEIRSSIAYNASTDRIYFSSKGGYCFALGIYANGTFDTSDKWSHSIGYSTSTPAVYNGKVYVGQGPFGNNGKLYCLDELDGSEEWSFTPNGGVQSSPALSIQNSGTNVYIYFTTNCENGRAYCLEDKGSTYDERWRYETNEAGTSGGYILQGVAISDGRVFFGNDGGYLYNIKEPAKKNERVHVYNFDSGESEDKWAFKYQHNSRPPSTCDVPDIEFNATEYTNIEADDDSSTFNQTTTANYYATHRFNITIEEYVANVTEIMVNWKGKGQHGNTSSDHNGSYLYIWNGTGYEELDNQTGVTWDIEYSLHGKITSGISGYVSSSGNVTILVQSVEKHAGNNASKLWTDYVELRVHTNVSRYDFRDGAGEDKWAYWKQLTQNEFNSGSPTHPNGEFSQTAYEKINTSDDTRQDNVTDADGYYAAHRFNFTILEDASDICKINVTWEGKGDHDSATKGAYLYIWNFTSTAYEELANWTTDNTEKTLTKEMTSGITNYNSSTNNVTILVNQTSTDIDGEEHSHIWTNYVKLELHIGD